MRCCFLYYTPGRQLAHLTTEMWLWGGWCVDYGVCFRPHWWRYVRYIDAPYYLSKFKTFWVLKHIWPQGLEIRDCGPGQKQKKIQPSFQEFQFNNNFSSVPRTSLFGPASPGTLVPSFLYVTPDELPCRSFSVQPSVLVRRHRTENCCPQRTQGPGMVLSQGSQTGAHGLPRQQTQVRELSRDPVQRASRSFSSSSASRPVLKSFFQCFTAVLAFFHIVKHTISAKKFFNSTHVRIFTFIKLNFKLLWFTEVLQRVTTSQFW